MGVVLNSLDFEKKLEKQLQRLDLSVNIGTTVVYSPHRACMVSLQSS